jgi:hypothetical protein
MLGTLINASASLMTSVIVTDITASRLLRRYFWVAVVIVAGLLSGCADSNPSLFATLTLKSDGSHYSGTVVRREPNSITLTSAGDTRTFLYTELADIQYGAPVKPAISGVSSDQQSATADKPGSEATRSGAGTANAVLPAGGIEFAEGTEFPIRSNGFLDSCCVPPNSVSLGVVDEDIKRNGAVVVPRGASVTMIMTDIGIVDGRITMTFELGSADFGGRHFVIAPTKGGLEPGIRATFSGATPGSPEAKLRGTAVHLENQSYMGFKAQSPVTFRLSQ